MRVLVHSLCDCGGILKRAPVECERTNKAGIEIPGNKDLAIKETAIRAATALQSIGETLDNVHLRLHIGRPDDHTGGTADFDTAVAAALWLAAKGKSPAGKERVFWGQLQLDGNIIVPEGEDISKLKLEKPILPGELGILPNLEGTANIAILKEIYKDEF